MAHINFSVAEEITISSSVMTFGGNINLFSLIHLEFASGVPYKFLRMTGFSAYKLKRKFLIDFAIYLWMAAHNSPLDLY